MEVNVIAARVGLTNKYHNQVIRNQELNMDTTVVDTLINQKLVNGNGGIDPSAILLAGAHGGGLQAVPLAFAGIQEGWNTSRGIMKLSLQVHSSQVNESYQHVIGYISNNSSTEGLSEDAVFTPVFSWEESKSIVSSLVGDPTAIGTNIGRFQDYLTINPETALNNPSSVRPCDILASGLSSVMEDNMMDMAADQGLDANNGMFQPNSMIFGSLLEKTGVIPSRRQNVNPSMYSAEIINQSINISSATSVIPVMSGNGNDGIFDISGQGSYGAIAEATNQLQCKERDITHDPFLSAMFSNLGRTNTAGFCGFSIADILFVFPELENVLDLTMFNSGSSPVDHTLLTDSMGTSTFDEVLSSMCTFNIMDLMLRNGIAAINIAGSNCDGFNDDLGNVTIFPSNVSFFVENDMKGPLRVSSFLESLNAQIFTKLAGLNPTTFTPVRFNISSHIFGETRVETTIVNDTNINDIGYSKTRVYPTFDLTAFSPVLGDTDSSLASGRNVVANLRDHFNF